VGDRVEIGDLELPDEPWRWHRQLGIGAHEPEQDVLTVRYGGELLKRISLGRIEVVAESERLIERKLLPHIENRQDRGRARIHIVDADSGPGHNRYRLRADKCYSRGRPLTVDE
jgi:hypothetical protein